MLHKKSEKGQALVLIAFAAVGLFAFTALSVDGGRVFSDRRHAQNAADTAALAAALAKLRAPLTPPTAADLAAVNAGLDRAASNGYANDADSTVEVVFCSDPAITQLCSDGGMPEDADPAEYIR
ncbi:MAG: pilus assembly protein TadG-related protein, partial [Chloroflexota bacterium]|nr:pilus assembly protein TadG-related protein [Chloroflexota bacterium]